MHEAAARPETTRKHCASLSRGVPGGDHVHVRFQRPRRMAELPADAAAADSRDTHERAHGEPRVAALNYIAGLGGTARAHAPLAELVQARDISTGHTSAYGH